MILVVDNYDSFTFNLVDYLHQLRLDTAVRRNDEPLDELISEQYEAVVLSPGPGTHDRAGNLMSIIDHFAEKLPILGICLGNQAIGARFGAKVTRAIRPMHGKISVVRHKNDSLFYNIPASFNVTRYHSLICNDLPESLEAIALTDQGEIMALKHKDLPLYGLQFHPEAVLTQYGLDILRNWQNINRLTN